LQAEALVKSMCKAPWSLTVGMDGEKRKYVLRFDSGRGEHEFNVLQAMESVPIPTPRAYGWDPEGQALGAPRFFIDFIEGESLLRSMLAGEEWAEELYLDTICTLQNITRVQLSEVEGRFIEDLTADCVIEDAHEHFQTNPLPLAEKVYKKLRDTMPRLPETRFSNGDLWLDNLIVRNRQLVGVIDFEGAGFSDPIFEFLLSFFVEPKLRGRGVEERYCQRMGFDPEALPWYHGLELFDTLRYTLATGETLFITTLSTYRVLSRNG
jgi:aminoglycoside phosphotransferase (APT) family kinase protein